MADLATIHEDLRDPDYDLLHRLLIPAGSAAPTSDGPFEPLPTALGYSRENEDKMMISATVPKAGYLRIDEAWDTGWHATVDGKNVPLIAGDDLFLTLPLSPGSHKVRLEFSTPGVVTGWIVAASCMGILVWSTRQTKRTKQMG
jgi:hypothetical protein